MMTFKSYIRQVHSSICSTAYALLQTMNIYSQSLNNLSFRAATMAQWYRAFASHAEMFMFEPLGTPGPYMQFYKTDCGSSTAKFSATGALTSETHPQIFSKPILCLSLHKNGRVLRHVHVEGERLTHICSNILPKFDVIEIHMPSH